MHVAMDDPVRHVLVGASASIASDIVMHPFSTVKTRLQVQGASGGNRGAVTYRGAGHAFWTIVHKEGPVALYRGLGVVLLASLPSQALYFGGYEFSKARLGGGQSSLGNLAAGLIAQLFGSLAWVPMDVIKQRLQIQGQIKVHSYFSGSFQGLGEIFRSEGPIGLYRGFLIHQMTWAPFNGIYFATYEKWKNWCLDAGYADEHDKLYLEAQLSCSGAAGVIAAGLTTPMDVLKTRLQVASANPEMFPFKNSWEAASHLVRHEGATALLDGLLARILWLTPKVAIQISGYEYIKSMLD